VVAGSLNAVMGDLVIDGQHLLDPTVIGEFYLSVSSGEYLTDAVVSSIIVYLRHQLQSWAEPHNDILRSKDNTLLCLSTLLSAVKKKLCTNGVLLEAMKDADLVSTLYCFTVNSRIDGVELEQFYCGQCLCLCCFSSA